MSVFPPTDPLTAGLKKPTSLALPTALVDALKRAAAIDGARSLSDYVTHMLVFALRQREQERDALKARK